MRGPAPYLLLALTAATAGCGSAGVTLHPVTGKVTYQNKPAAGALVVFHPKGDSSPQAVRPSGTVQPDGTYVLFSGPGEAGKGAPAGEYEVAVIWATPAKGGKGMALGDERREEADALGGKYKSPASSGLRATVAAGPTEVPAFDLK